MSTAPLESGAPAPGIPGTPLHELLRPAPAIASRTALIDAATGRRWTHQELSDLALASAAAFRRAGVAPGERVLLDPPNGVGFVTGLLGLLTAGTVVSPVVHGTPGPELARRSEAIGARRTLTGDGGRLSAPRPAPASGRGGGPAAKDPPADLALLPWSSGTTGSPKPVALTHRNLVAGLLQLSAAQPLSPDDVLLGVLPFSHVFGLQYVLNHALFTGASVVLLPRWDAAAALDAVDTHGVTLLHAVPTMVHDLAERAASDHRRPHSLHQVLSGGAPLPAGAAIRCEQALGVPVDGAYGLTEANTSHFVRRGGPRRAGSSGYPVPGTEYRVVPPGGTAEEAVEDTVNGTGGGRRRTGELLLRGPQVADGFLGPDGRLVRIADAEGWLATGDLVEVDDDGCLRVVDRLKDIIKCRGHQVSPSEVEAVLRDHPAVLDAVLVAVDHPRDGERPVARVVLTPGTRLTPRLATALQDFVTERLAPHNRPHRITGIPAVERTASGKPLRRLHRSPGPAPEGSGGVPEPPDLTGRTVLVTGGSRGLGRALAEDFLRHGARVAITGRDPATLAEARTALAALGEVRAAAVDSADHRALCELAARLETDGFAVDTLVCNSGVAGPSGPAWENDPEQWWATQEANLRGTFLPCHVFLPTVIEGHGRIIAVASHAGHHRWPHMSAYSVSKAAVIKFTENLAAELRHHGVAVFAYHPGLLTIGMAAAHFTSRPAPGSWDARIQRWYLDEHAAGRTVTTGRSTRGALLLAAGACDHLSGSYLTPDHPALSEGPRPTEEKRHDE
ncbi:SDR family NAD(P)-dependent oxidoreductase [Streptomyces clavuligerus]|nr:SDR family NAD(P)-dependent oxidoreductase [Streptomyces clavuligerus]WDN57367.1 SDR family NAD(P)-dependent oxidoreductase [Streptomyces clavuligerus]